MASFDTVNYSLRTNKAIQRLIVFDALAELDRCLSLRESAFIGLGSIWFTDFVLAHKRLGIQDMLSMEKDPIGASRAEFNKPFRTVRVVEAPSSEVLDNLHEDELFGKKPWVVWLDYDYGPVASVRDDIQRVVVNAPPNTVLLVTVNVGNKGVGSPSLREETLRGIYGNAVRHDAGADDFKDDRIDQAIEFGRPGGFTPAFTVPYRDSAPMLTVGGVLPAKGAVSTVRACIESAEWPGFVSEPLEVPPLTAKETSALQSLLPSVGEVTEADVEGLGFRLKPEMIRSFSHQYVRYPTFVQIAL